MKRLFLLIAIISGSLFNLQAQTKQIESKKGEPRGIYKEIDVENSNKMIEILNGNNKEQTIMAIDNILKTPNNFNPPVFYVLSKVLFDDGKKEEASFWFFTAQLRARYDANLCLDNSAKQAVTILNNEYGPRINQYAFDNVSFLENTVKNVVSFVKENNENYDHRWLNLHGMQAILTSMGEKTEKTELSKPREEWDKIKQATIDDFFSGFSTYLKSLKK